MPEQSSAAGAIVFGPFRLLPTQRLLLKGEKPTRTGSRALEILTYLVQHAGKVVGKDELISRVWPDTFVEETNLRVHIAALRKALGDTEANARYISTVPGRGYCFVAPVERLGATVPSPDDPKIEHNLAPLSRVFGRQEAISMVMEQLWKNRFVTIVGPAGIGKTTVGLSVAHSCIGAYADGIRFVDLTPLHDHKLVPNVVAFVLGLGVHSDDVLAAVTNFLARKEMLLVLDNCEHVIDAVAILAEQVLKSAPGLQIVATSREPLRITGEYVQRISSLAVPAVSDGLTAAEALKFPAVQLFVERAAASLDSYVLTDLDAPIVADICRRLDGIALAIELTAVRADILGIRGLASLLNDRFKLLTTGRRTALRRHQTLGAAIAWSHELLGEPERKIFRRLAVFNGDFTPEASSTIAADATVAPSDVFDLIVGLIEKSLVIADVGGNVVNYRLLETTRAYALERLLESGEFDALSGRHAAFYRDHLNHVAAEGTRPQAGWLTNVRTALEWCFGGNGDLKVGIDLAVVAAPAFLRMSMLTECHNWSEKALQALHDDARGGAEEMHLQAASGLSLMFTRNATDAAGAALRRSLTIAEQRGDTIGQLKLLASLQLLHTRLGEYKTALQYARRSIAVAATTEEPAAKILAHSLLGNSLHFAGDIDQARAEFEAVLRAARSPRANDIYLGFDHHNRASIMLARNLWLQGYPAKAIEQARQSVAEAVNTGHPVTIYLARIWAITTFLWTGNYDEAEDLTDILTADAESHAIGFYVALGRGFRGALAIHRNNAEQGIDSLFSCLDELHPTRYELLTTTFNIALVQGLGATGRIAESFALVEETISRVETAGDHMYMPELLRLKGGAYLLMACPRIDDAEACFKESMAWSRRQGARAWELRTAIDLAALWAGRGEREGARELLQPVFEQFDDGQDTSDVAAAARLLAALK